jgi:acarbose 7IV-phosphotransferase
VGFLSSFVRDGYDLEDAIRRGQIVARYTCTQKASSSHFMTRDMLDEQWSQAQTSWSSEVGSAAVVGEAGWDHSR